MNNKIKAVILTLAVAIGLGLGLGTNAVTHNTSAAKKPVTIENNNSNKPQIKNQNYSYQDVKALDVVANPAKYLNKRIRITAKFDKFSNLGLDYKPAFRSSEKYISFLIKRDDVTNHTIPLSEMKIFLNRTEAEKHIDLDAGDEVEFSGLVFSNALGDPWIDVEKFKVLTVKPKKDQKSIKK